ncbi:hypothetical protein I0C86_28515 [Plantactinospora sp. S1510]|uniref:SMI1/KNR4 family protein n=1 Tax=Plantactinospora alkalitolerans TaxID=2789879 RepID=A0ABS0H332_9ACTN|nr:hypothetical protein [Plantactinospora alkalitolerans]MBF9132872.1 hypothetical protein [Plantactinospora alkalitolerans]
MDDRGDLARRVAAQVGVLPPAALLDIWTDVTPLDVSVDVDLYDPGQISERNTTYEIPIYRPDLLLIGTDGGGRGFFVQRGDPDAEVVRIGLGAVGSDDGTRLGRLAALVTNGWPGDDDDPQEDGEGDGPLGVEQ